MLLPSNKNIFFALIGYNAVQPPSNVKFVPVMYFDASDDKNIVAHATS